MPCEAHRATLFVGEPVKHELIPRFPGRAGRNRISKEIRDLIFRMVAENPTWGAPRIHGELIMPGFDASERTISRWIRKAPRDPEPSKRWLAFLRNHREAIAAMDFFTVPTITFGVLYCFFVIGHDRRRILHFNVTRHPTSLWVVQQRPWQNGVAERWVQSCRRDLLDHVIPLNERHLMRLLSDYVRYYHEDRTHLGLGKETPFGRPHSHGSGLVLSRARPGGCIIVTIELLNPHRCSVVQRTRFLHPVYMYMYICICAQLVRAFPAGENFAP